MDPTSLNNAAALSQYTSSLLARRQGASGGTAGGADALATKLAAAPSDFRSRHAQQALDTRQAALGRELAHGLAKAGVKLAGTVSFALGADGSVAVDGSAADKAAVQDWLKSDTATPSLRSRIGEALKSAQELSASTQRNNAISLAARYGGPSANVMAMYSQFMGHADATPAVMRFDGTASTLGYPGALHSQA